MEKFKHIQIKGQRTFRSDSSQYLGEDQYTPGYEVAGKTYPAYRINEAWSSRHWGGNYQDLSEIDTATLDAIYNDMHSA